MASARSDKKNVLRLIDQGIGASALNEEITRLLRGALVAAARAAIERLPAAERGASVKLSNTAGLLLV